MINSYNKNIHLNRIKFVYLLFELMISLLRVVKAELLLGDFFIKDDAESNRSISIVVIAFG